MACSHPQAAAQIWGVSLVFSTIFGRSAGELGAQVASNEAWPLPSCPTGIIAGDCSLALWPPLSWLTSAAGLMEGGGDGTVAVRWSCGAAGWAALLNACCCTSTERQCCAPRRAWLLRRETRLPPEAETDFATVHTTHRALIDHPLTLQLVLSFLRHQSFAPEGWTQA